MSTFCWSELVAFVCAEIKALHDLSKDVTFINIDGFTATGKSTLTKAMLQELNQIGFDVEILSTDDFIRFNRSEINVAMKEYANHKDWYDLKRLSNLVHDIKRSAPINFVLDNLYNHLTGRLNASRQFSIKKDSIIIIDGMYSMEFRADSAYKIILVAQHKELQKRVIKRAHERGMAPSIAKERYWLHNGAVYQSNLAATIMSADLIVDTTDMAKPEIITLKNDTPEKYMHTLNKYIQQRINEL